jgi:acetyl/propionyl-CoA carboxylase alpha subunit
MEYYFVTGEHLRDQHFEVCVEGTCATINDRSFRIELIDGTGLWECSMEDRTVPAYVECDATGTVRITIGGYPYVVKCYQARLRSLLGIINHAQKQHHHTIAVRAPMPGFIKAVHIAEGTVVRRGESVIVLEAMKMENLLRAPLSGTVRSVNVAAGRAVEKGDVLCIIERDSHE